MLIQVDSNLPEGPANPSRSTLSLLLYPDDKTNAPILSLLKSHELKEPDALTEFGIDFNREELIQFLRAALVALESKDVAT